VEPGSTVHTDGWQAYWTVPEHGYTHERTVMRKHNDPAPVVMPGVHRVASLLERWLLGTHQGGVSSEHLDAYLTEFTFRLHCRHSPEFRSWWARGWALRGRKPLWGLGFEGL
jgi:hypothetical protein